MKKNRKKRLPKYWLGTRMPASLGYQPNQGAGNVSYSTTKGEDFTAEANASRANILPSAFNRLQQSTTPLLNMFQNTTKATAPGATVALTGVARAAARRAGESVAQFVPDALPGAAPGSMSAGASSTGSAAGSAGATATRTALNAAGKALGIVGAAYGAANMAMDFAHNQDHRTAADMWNTVNTSTYTTDKGNTYNTYSAPNLQAELDYASSQKTSRNLNNTINAAGTGAAIGSVIAPGIGTIIGGAAGALYGLGSWLFGFGDTYEDVVNEYKKTQDVAALKSLQSEASAKNKDVRQGFYERSNDTKAGAAKGKAPVYTPEGPSNKKATAKVSNGEVIGNFEDGYVSRVPGEKNNKDTKYANLKNSDFVISNKFGLSDYAAATGDYVGALKMQDMLMKQYRNKAKNGKLPKCVNGWGDYALSTLPHLGSVLTNLSQYHRVKNAEEYAPTITTEAPAAQNAINQMMAERIDPRQYLNRTLLNYNQAAWNARRTPGMGLGGRMVMLDSLARAKQAQDADTMLKIDEANRAQRNKGYEARINLDRFLAEQNTKNAWMQHAYRQQAHGQKETWLAQYLKNMDQGLINAAGDALRTSQFHQAQDIKNRELNIWEQYVENEKLKRLDDLARMGGNKENEGKTGSIKTKGTISTPTYSLNFINRGYPWTGYGNVFNKDASLTMVPGLGYLPYSNYMFTTPFTSK